MVKTDELLATINMTCPGCHQKAEIEFHREIATLPVPFLKLKKVGGIAGKCLSCGQDFPYPNPSKLYKYMDKSGIPYQRSYFMKNLVALSAPIIVLIALIAIVSTVAPLISPILENALHDSTATSGNEVSPLVLANFSIIAANQTTCATFKLAANSSPVDMAALNVSVLKNGTLLYESIWRYNNSSISWTGKNHTGSILDQGDTAKVTVNLTKYHFNSTDRLQLEYQILDTIPYVHAFTIGNQTVSHGNDTTSGNASKTNASTVAILSGYVYLNNMTSPGVILTFTGGSKTPYRIISDNSGYYSISVTPNKTYSLAVDDPDIPGIKYNKTSIKVVNNTTYNVRLYT